MEPISSDDWKSSAKVYSLLAEKTRHLRIINDLAIDLLRLDSVEEVLWIIAKSAIANLNFEDCIIYLVDETGTRLIQRAAHGPKNPAEKEIKDPITIPVGEGIVGYVAQTGQPELVRDTAKDPRYIIDDAARASEITVPILHDDRVIGVIDSEHEQANFFTNEHIEVLTIIASMTSTKLASCMLIEELESTVSRLQETQVALETKERELEYLASHDSLTDLYNRRALMSTGGRLVAKSRENEERSAIWYLDLDHFRLVNDRFGHAAGDELLKQLAYRLNEEIGDDGVVGRIGGDEFVVLFPDIGAEESIPQCQRLIQHISQAKYNCAGHHVSIGLSIGITEISPSVRSLSTVIEAADKASYLAKQAGRNQYHLITRNDKLYREYAESASWAMEINDALETNRFTLHAQPIVLTSDPGNRNVPMYECLLRMTTKEGEVIPATKFIKTSERYGQINALDRWVIREALAWIKRRSKHGPCPLLSINVSGLSVSDPSFPDFLLGELESATTDDSRPNICMEITETSAISNLQQLIQLMEQLKQEGVLTALDDFGSGYASFEILKHLPIDIVKIDRIFTETVHKDIDRKMIQHINDVAHLIGAKTVAEGVEDADTLSTLNEIGVDYAQGYYIAFPIELSRIDF